MNGESPAHGEETLPEPVIGRLIERRQCPAPPRPAPPAPRPPPPRRRPAPPRPGGRRGRRWWWAAGVWAYAIVEAIDGRTHRSGLLRSGAHWRRQGGSHVEARAYDDAKGRKRLSLAARSDLTGEEQVTAPGCDLDRPPTACARTLGTCGSFGAELRDSMERRIDYLAGEGLAGGKTSACLRTRFTRNLSAAGTR